MHASHREICKFDSPEDTGYLTLKNSLTFVVQGLLQEGRQCICHARQPWNCDLAHMTDFIVFAAHEIRSRMQTKTIKEFLGVPSLEDELLEKVEGSCQWIEDRDDFRDWRDITDDLSATATTSYSPAIYWVSASPGTGKSVLATHVVSQLEEFRLQCAHYYFHAGKTSNNSLAGCLRSIALQMAIANSAIREAIGKLCDDQSVIDVDDPRAVWLKIFRAIIFQVRCISDASAF